MRWGLSYRGEAWLTGELVVGVVQVKKHFDQVPFTHGGKSADVILTWGVNDDNFFSRGREGSGIRGVTGGTIRVRLVGMNGGD